MKNSETSHPITKRPASEGQAASILKDVSVGSLDSLPRGIVLNGSRRILEIDFENGIKTLAHGGNEWTY
jgi:hypothetical protein